MARSLKVDVYVRVIYEQKSVLYCIKCCVYMKPMKLYHILHFEKACILSCHVFLGLHRVHLREKKGNEFKRGEIFQSLFNLH